MTKNEMVVNIAKATGLKQADIKKIVQMVLDGIIDVLVSDRRIELRNFGVFEVRHRKARKARNPRTGEEVMVPDKNVVTFKPGRIMNEKIV
jgi:nucleoid DNA-binding protein